MFLKGVRSYQSLRPGPGDRSGTGFSAVGGSVGGFLVKSALRESVFGS